MATNEKIKKKYKKKWRKNLFDAFEASSIYNDDAGQISAFLNVIYYRFSRLIAVHFHACFYRGIPVEIIIGTIISNKFIFVAETGGESRGQDEKAFLVTVRTLRTIRFCFMLWATLYWPLPCLRSCLTIIIAKSSRSFHRRLMFTSNCQSGQWAVDKWTWACTRKQSVNSFFHKKKFFFLGKSTSQGNSFACLTVQNTIKHSFYKNFLWNEFQEVDGSDMRSFDWSKISKKKMAARWKLDFCQCFSLKFSR